MAAVPEIHGIWVGTSGYNYPEWKGSFYPATLPAAKMLPYYAERFPTVEINYTFYRTPNEKILDGWNQATPDRFKLTLKAPKRITHDARLRDCGDRVRQFLETAAIARAEARGAAVPAAAEPEEGSRALRRVSRCVSAARPRGVRVPPCVVVRRRGVRAAARTQPGAVHRRQREALDAGRDDGRLRATSGCATKATPPPTSHAGPEIVSGTRRHGDDVFVYFKHEEAGKGPEFAQLLMTQLG